MARSDAKAGTQSLATIFDVGGMIAANQRGFEAAAEAQRRMLGRMSQVTSEVMNFVGRRLERDRDTVRRLADCRSPQDAVALYGEFVESAVKEYTEEIGVLAGLCADQAQDVVAGARHLADDAVPTSKPENKDAA